MGAATRQRYPEAAPSRWRRAIEGARTRRHILASSFVFGVPWIFHIGGFDGLWPSAAIGVLIGLTRGDLVVLAVVVAMSVLLLAIGYTPLIVGPSRSLIRNDPLPPNADAIVVLAGGTNDDGLICRRQRDRLFKGLELLNGGSRARARCFTREADRWTAIACNVTRRS